MSVPLEASRAPVPSDQTQSTRSVALYIGRMSAELGRLAQRHHLEPLAYILEMARQEADQTARGAVDTAQPAPAARASHK
jgi:hypothetical protein